MLSRSHRRSREVEKPTLGGNQHHELAEKIKPEHINFSAVILMTLNSKAWKESKEFLDDLDHPWPENDVCGADNGAYGGNY